jgi:hypothetical protein
MTSNTLRAVLPARQRPSYIGHFVEHLAGGAPCKVATKLNWHSVEHLAGGAPCNAVDQATGHFVEYLAGGAPCMAVLSRFSNIHTKRKDTNIIVFIVAVSIIWTN